MTRAVERVELLLRVAGQPLDPITISAIAGGFGPITPTLAELEAAGKIRAVKVTAGDRSFKAWVLTTKPRFRGVVEPWPTGDPQGVLL